MSTSFADSKFIRSSCSVSFEERGAQPSDFTAARGYVYAAEYADNPSTFDKLYPTWQTFADAFVMRRAVIAISGKQRCTSDSVGASEVSKYSAVGFQAVKNFKKPGSDSDSIPAGQYQITAFEISDEGNGYSNVSISYQQYGEWSLVKLSDVAAPVKAV